MHNNEKEFVQLVTTVSEAYRIDKALIEKFHKKSGHKRRMPVVFED